MILDRVPAGSSIFIDSSIFIYHFTAVSVQCRDFLERCELGEIRGMTSVVVLAEVAHRLMMIEAVAAGSVTAGNVAKKLRERPAVVRKLRIYSEQVERIPLMGIEVMPVSLKTFSQIFALQRGPGLLVNDSLVAAAAGEAGAGGIASADRDFERLRVRLYWPSDLP